MKLNDFKLEVYLGKYEFTAPYLLTQSDCESMTIENLLNFESDAEEKFKKSWLGYTEVLGNPELREEIAKLYKNVTADGNWYTQAPKKPFLIFRMFSLNQGIMLFVSFLCTNLYMRLHSLSAVKCQNGR